MSQRVAKEMIKRGGGKIINMVSQNGVVGYYKRAAYCSSKAGVVNLTRVLALEWAKYGINVNAVGPTFFLTPPHIIPLVEVVKGTRTSNRTASVLMGMGRRLGKRPILVKRDVPGFVGNRLQFAVFREALHLLSEGIASAEDIDTAMTAGPGFRYGLLGPLRTADPGGLDVFHSISKYLFAQLASTADPPGLLPRLIKRNRLGTKTGKGFYEYKKGEAEALLKERDRILLLFRKILESKGNG